MPKVPPVPMGFKTAFERFLQEWMLQEVIARTEPDSVSNIQRSIAHMTKCYVERTDDKQQYQIIICVPPELKDNRDPYDMGYADVARLVRVNLKPSDPRATAEYDKASQKIIVHCRDLKSFSQAFDVLMPQEKPFPASDYFSSPSRGR